ncbi:GHKL domain-containing protein [Alteromonas sediminis]|uniref:histidine kinase n=2 Tax=Alteromonas sediminis TaxID=2259342 RepID=A0A3N5Y989_9ALTE|nr:GHKL domain-containing protein [Alteromonas sediminis]
MPAGVVLINGKGVVMQSNPQARHLLGEPLEGQAWRTIIKRAFNPRADDGHEVSLTNGKRVKLDISPLEGEPGQIILITDLTETRQLQARISHMQRLSSLGKMVASLAHQIRTPLSAAMLYAVNLSQKSVAETVRTRFSGRLVDRLKELESQVNDMLLFAKSGDQQVLSTLTPLDLLEAVEATSQAIGNKKGVAISFSGFEVMAEFKGNLPALQGALLNLIDNAIQVSNPDDIVNVSAHFQGDAVSVKVSDKGQGIAKSSLNKIFTPFFTTKSNGTGLGLAVVNSVAQSHGGQVSVESELGKGTQFTFSIPAQRALLQAAGE